MADHRGGGVPVPAGARNGELHLRVLRVSSELAAAHELRAFVEHARSALESLLPGSTVTLVDVDRHEPGEGVVEEQPTFHLLAGQPDWSPIRLSDLIPKQDLARTTLPQVLDRLGGRHVLSIPLTSPHTGRITCFFVNRPEPDFSDAELELAVRLQPALVALYRRLTDGPSVHEGLGGARLSPAERVVLGHLASGLTADAIATRLSTSRRTVGKHVQNLCTKLGVSDAEGAIARARELGLVRPPDVPGEGRPPA